MTRVWKRKSTKQLLAGAVVCLLGWQGLPGVASAQSMSNYTNMPITINKTVPANVLFLVDSGNYTLEAAYAGSNHYYPLSFSVAANTYASSIGYYSANTTLGDVTVEHKKVTGQWTCAVTSTGIGTRAQDLNNSIIALTGSQTGTSLTPTECQPGDVGVPIPEYQFSNLPDTFNSATKYYGIFDPERCYTYAGSGQGFQIGTDASAVKGTGNYSSTCPNTKWDGNFLNWLTMRKDEVIQKVLVGGSGKTSPAQANADGTANSLAGEPSTGENGASSKKCSNSSNSCWRYVKYVPLAASSGRVPDALPHPVTVISNGALALSGIFFGMGEGQIFVNDNGGVNPFDAASGNQYAIKVDLTSEPDVPSGTGSFSSPSCDEAPPIDTTIFAGHRVCYQRSQSLGIFQKLETGNMHVAVMMINASTGKGGSLHYGFDETFNSSVVATLRNLKIEAKAPLAESLYEALCLYRKSQGPCYANSGSAASWGTNYTTAIGGVGDPFYYADYSRMVECCKNYVVMISPGAGTFDGDNPDLSSPPFPTGSTINPLYASNIGVKASSSSGDAASAAAGDRLDDLAFYGRTTDLRSDVTGKQYVTFYGVNALGHKAGATLLASAAKYGGFNDKNSDGTSNFTPTSGQTCVYPAGSPLNPGTGGPFYSDPEWDAKGPSGPDCIPDTFYDAQDGYALADQIQNAINDILQNSSSGTSISVLASSSSGEGSIYQAYFYPETVEDNRKVRWSGYLQGLFIDSFGNLREDRGGASGAPDGRLVYLDDPIIKTTTDPETGDVLVQRFADSNGNGQADDGSTPDSTVPLREVQGLWEAGKKLALRNIATTAKPRNLFAWVDKDNDGVVDSNEQVAFTTANASVFAPYLRAASSGTNTAANIISFIQGNQVSGMRDRELTVEGSKRVWRLGDIVNSSPTIVGPPRERFDILYGDTGYRQFLQRWATRRQTLYVGANDGMLHAFNVGYYHRGDDPSTSAKQEHGWYTTAPADNSSGPELGEELWGFIPHYILPQLMWLTENGYTHVSYVDLKPKVTDVRIFTPETACGSSSTPTPTATGCIHPDGWGTILIMGLRFGGSCGQCAAVSGTSNGGPPLSVTADFDGTGSQTRYFYSGYVVLDITDPDAPQVLTAYSSANLGLTTAYPSVVRVSPSGDGKNDHTNAKWLMVVGSGVHGYDGRAAAAPSLIAVPLGLQGTVPTPTVMPVGTTWGYMAEAITFDRDLDFRSDAVYVGQTLSGASSSGASHGTGLGYWSGKFLRLTMGTCSASCSTGTWGVASGSNRVPTEIVADVPISGTSKPLGPVVAGSSVTLDDSGNTWIFFGTGRFMSQADKMDQHPQYLVGVKDSVMRGAAGCTQSTTTNCQNQNLMDVTNVKICITSACGAQVQGAGTINTFSSLVTGVTAKDGWVIELPANSSSTELGAERSVVNPTLIGGAVFFPTFTPDSNPCVAQGHSNIYGLYYLTGTGHTSPIFGVAADGSANKSVSVGQGMASSLSVAIGGSPTGLTGICQSSNANFCLVKPKVPDTLWSQYLSWIAQRT